MLGEHLWSHISGWEPLDQVFDSCKQPLVHVSQKDDIFAGHIESKSL